MTKRQVTIDAMHPNDWQRVKAIYVEGIESGQATFETEAPSWESWDASHLQIPRLVARADENIIGWAALSPVSKRQTYAGVAEVSVYVAHHHRRAVVGDALLRALVDESEANR